MSYYFVFFFFFKQKTAYEMRISDWSSDVCSPISIHQVGQHVRGQIGQIRGAHAHLVPHFALVDSRFQTHLGGVLKEIDRSEEHTSELQSLMRISYAVFCLKKKNYIMSH